MDAMSWETESMIVQLLGYLLIALSLVMLVLVSALIWRGRR